MIVPPAIGWWRWSGAGPRIIRMTKRSSFFDEMVVAGVGLSD
jgi:hypothetical protein